MSKLPKTRKEAEAQGSKLFKLGHICARGHSCPRYTINGYCVTCVEEGKGAYERKLDNYPFSPAQRNKEMGKYKGWFETNPQRY